MNYCDEDYEILWDEDDARIPNGWSVAVYEDGKAYACSPGTAPRDFCNLEPYDTVEDAIAVIIDQTREEEVKS